MEWTKAGNFKFCKGRSVDKTLCITQSPIMIMLISNWYWFKSLAPGISYEIALRWMPLDLTDDKSTLGQVMAWCRQATSHYLSQCWPRSMSPNGITRPQWVKVIMTHENYNLNIHNSYLQNIAVTNWIYFPTSSYIGLSSYTGPYYRDKQLYIPQVMPSGLLFKCLDTSV